MGKHSKGAGEEKFQNMPAPFCPAPQLPSPVHGDWRTTPPLRPCLAPDLVGWPSEPLSISGGLTGARPHLWPDPHHVTVEGEGWRVRPLVRPHVAPPHC